MTPSPSHCLILGLGFLLSLSCGAMARAGEHPAAGAGEKGVKLMNRIGPSAAGLYFAGADGSRERTALNVMSLEEIEWIDTGSRSSILVVPEGSRADIGMTEKDQLPGVVLGKLEVVSDIKISDVPAEMAWVGKP